MYTLFTVGGLSTSSSYEAISVLRNLSPEPRAVAASSIRTGDAAIRDFVVARWNVRARINNNNNEKTKKETNKRKVFLGYG